MTTETTTQHDPKSGATIASTRKRGRANGEGSVYREGDKWVAAVDLGVVEGKRKRKRLRYDTQAEARRALTRMRKAVDDGVSTGDDRITVKAFLEKWLREHVEKRGGKLREATRSSYALHVNKHLVPGLGHHTLAKLTPLHVQAFLTAKLSEMVTTKDDNDVEHSEPRFAPRTVQYIHATLKVALKQAERWGYVSRNVARLIDTVHVPKKEARMLSTAEAGALLAAVDADRLRALFYVAIFHGLRRSELCGLKWEDLDLVRGELRVRRQLRRVLHKRVDGAIVERGGLVEMDLKTERSRRAIKLAPGVVEALNTHGNTQALERGKAGDLWTETGYVFTTPTGGALDGDNLYKRWHRILESAGLPEMPFHATRHTAGSFMLAKGADLRTVMGVLGHSEIAVTANVYAHVLEEMNADAAAKADAALNAVREAAKARAT